jgi:DNA-3-methyladenine glycosylase
VGAAVLIRALEPLENVDLMRERRGVEREQDLCSGPGKLTKALGIGLELNETPLTSGGGGPIELLPRSAAPGHPDPPRLVAGGRVGITRAVELPWRFCDAAAARWISHPRPPELRRQRRVAAVSPFRA